MLDIVYIVFKLFLLEYLYILSNDISYNIDFVYVGRFCFEILSINNGIDGTSINVFKIGMDFLN